MRLSNRGKLHSASCLTKAKEWMPPAAWNAHAVWQRLLPAGSAMQRRLQERHKRQRSEAPFEHIAAVQLSSFHHVPSSSPSPEPRLTNGRLIYPGCRPSLRIAKLSDVTIPAPHEWNPNELVDEDRINGRVRRSAPMPEYDEEIFSRKRRKAGSILPACSERAC
jgi:hypothetical protein